MIMPWSRREEYLEGFKKERQESSLPFSIKLWMSKAAEAKDIVEVLTKEDMEVIVTYYTTKEKKVVLFHERWRGRGSYGNSTGSKGLIILSQMLQLEYVVITPWNVDMVLAVIKRSPTMVKASIRSPIYC